MTSAYQSPQIVDSLPEKVSVEMYRNLFESMGPSCDPTSESEGVKYFENPLAMTSNAALLGVVWEMTWIVTEGLLTNRISPNDALTVAEQTLSVMSTMNGKELNQAGQSENVEGRVCSSIVPVMASLINDMDSNIKERCQALPMKYMEALETLNR